MNIKLSTKSEDFLSQIKFFCKMLFDSAYYITLVDDQYISKEDRSFDIVDTQTAMIQAYERFENPKSSNPPNTPLTTTLALAYLCQRNGIQDEINARILVLRNYHRYNRASFMLATMDHIDFAVDPGKVLGLLLFQSLSSLSQYSYSNLIELDLKCQSTLGRLISVY